MILLYKVTKYSSILIRPKYAWVWLFYAAVYVGVCGENSNFCGESNNPLYLNAISSIFLLKYLGGMRGSRFKATADNKIKESVDEQHLLFIIKTKVKKIFISTPKFSTFINVDKLPIGSIGKYSPYTTFVLVGIFSGLVESGSFSYTLP